MSLLRFVLLVGCAVAVFLSLTFVPWESKLIDHGGWIVDLGTYPIWQRPADPDYEFFRKQFRGSDGFPSRDGNWVIQTNFDPPMVAARSLTFCWPVMIVSGLIYLVIRGSRRDLVLQCALFIAGGMVLGVVASLTLWLIFGGWEPPHPLGFLWLGTALGLVGGIGSSIIASRKAALAVTLDHQSFNAGP